MQIIRTIGFIETQSALVAAITHIPAADGSNGRLQYNLKNRHADTSRKHAVNFTHPDAQFPKITVYDQISCK